MADRAEAASVEDFPAPHEPWRNLSISAQDGLRLHARDYGYRAGPWLPVVCLPGLTRNARDFHELALHLSEHRQRPRRVLSIDYRGRGGSERDPNWRNYTPLTEAQDVLQILTASGIGHAIFVGTSRGGIITMLLGALRPTVLRAVVLNDVGPEIDGRGLLRIKNTLMASRSPANWDAAANLLQRAYAQSFPNIDHDGWMSYARKTYADKDGTPVIDYDPMLIKMLDEIDFDRPLPSLWPEFDALSHVPVLVVRGANSDLLSTQTLEHMQQRRPDLDSFVVDDAGHAPMLADAAELNRVAAFITAADKGR